MLDTVINFVLPMSKCGLGFLTSFGKERAECIDNFEPRCEKTDFRGFQPGPTQTGL